MQDEASDSSFQETVLPVLTRISPPPGLGIETVAVSRDFDAAGGSNASVVENNKGRIPPSLIWALLLILLMAIVVSSIAAFCRFRK